LPAALRGNAGQHSHAAAMGGRRMLCQSLNAQFASRGIHVAHIVIDGAVDAPDTLGKMLGADAAWAAAEACVQTHGGFGFAEEYDIERKFRETRLYQVAPISTNLILSYLAEHVLGLPRSY
jgi:alkylation response protein AidB-like acyl-CoA dehydrogenase